MNLRVVGASLVVSIKSFYREKTTMFFTTTFPILLILVFGTIFMDQDKLNFDLCVQDLDQSDAAAEITKALDQSGTFKLTHIDPAIDPAQYAKHNQVNLVLIIPKGFEKAYLQYLQSGDAGASATVTYVYDPSSNSVDTKMRILNMVLAQMNQELTGKGAFREDGGDLDTHQEIQVHRVLHPRHHRHGGNDREPFRHGEPEHGTAAEGDYPEVGHHTHHPYRLGAVEHCLPVHSRRHIHHCNADSQLCRV